MPGVERIVLSSNDLAFICAVVGIGHCELYKRNAA